MKDKDKNRTVTITMPEHLYKVIKGRADRKDRSLAGQIRHICEEYFYNEDES